MTHECEKCETLIKNKILNLSDNEFSITSFGQTTFVCPKCGLKHFIGDIDIYTDENEENSEEEED